MSRFWHALMVAAILAFLSFFGIYLFGEPSNQIPPQLAEGVMSSASRLAVSVFVGIMGLYGLGRFSDWARKKWNE